MSDEGAAERILTEVGFSIGSWFGRRGKSGILKKINGYNEAAKYNPWFVLVDLDNDFPCAGEARTMWLPDPSDQMCFRVAVPELEAWLLGEATGIASFLGVSSTKIPQSPEELDDPKQALINLARKSRRREVREGLVPTPGTGANVGPTYASDIAGFARQAWDVRSAALRCPSLDRCLNRLVELRASIDG
jgi:hypothetical protein